MYKYAWLVLGMLQACGESKEDFSFSVGIGSSSDSSDTGSAEETESSESIAEPTSDSQQEPTDEPIPSTEEDDCAIPEESLLVPPAQLEGRVDCGEIVYFTHCAGCHGDNGEGGPNGQILFGHISGHGDFDLIRSIVEGEGTMPPQDLESQEVADVIAYMRANF